MYQKSFRSTSVLYVSSLCLLSTFTCVLAYTWSFWWWWCLLFVLAETTTSPTLYTHSSHWVLSTGIKESTCDYATIMSLIGTMMILFPFRWRVGALKTSPFNHSQCAFIQMTDTDVTFLTNYNNMDLSRLYVMILTSPPSLPRSRLWAGLGVR